jgi:hypothetical protein
MLRRATVTVCAKTSFLVVRQRATPRPKLAKLTPCLLGNDTTTVALSPQLPALALARPVLTTLVSLPLSLHRPWAVRTPDLTFITQALVLFPLLGLALVKSMVRLRAARQKRLLVVETPTPFPPSTKLPHVAKRPRRAVTDNAVVPTKCAKPSQPHREAGSMQRSTPVSLRT